MESHLIIICEECGKKYRVDTDKILGQVAGFSCRSCGHRILVTRPRPTVSDPPDDAARQRPALEQPLGSDRSAQAETSDRRPRQSGISLKAKTLLILFIVPAGIAAAAGFLFLEQAEEMVSSVHREAFFMLLLLWSGLILSTLVLGLWFGLRLSGRIRRLAETAERVVSVSPASGDELGRLEDALARLEDIVAAPDAGHQAR